MFWRFLEDEDKPQLLNMVPTNPTLNREWVAHLCSVFGIDNIEESNEGDLNLSPTITKLLKDKVQVTSKNLYALAGKYHIPPVITDPAYFKKLVDNASDEFLDVANEKAGKKDKSINYEKLIKLYFEDFLPSVLNTDGFIDKAISKGKEIGFKIKETSDDIWILKSQNGESIAQKSTLENQKPKVCFKLSSGTLFRLLEKRFLCIAR